MSSHRLYEGLCHIVLPDKTQFQDFQIKQYSHKGMLLAIVSSGTYCCFLNGSQCMQKYPVVSCFGDKQYVHCDIMSGNHKCFRKLIAYLFLLPNE